MSLPLRITFENKDYAYIVLTKGITKDTTEIEIALDGQPFTLVRHKDDWIATGDTAGVDPRLLTVIGKAVYSRYRR